MLSYEMYSLQTSEGNGVNNFNMRNDFLIAARMYAIQILNHMNSRL